MAILVGNLYAQHPQVGYQCDFWKSKRYFESKDVSEISHNFTHIYKKQQYEVTIFINDSYDLNSNNNYAIIKQNDGKNFTSQITCKKI